MARAHGPLGVLAEPYRSAAQRGASSPRRRTRRPVRRRARNRHASPGGDAESAPVLTKSKPRGCISLTQYLVEQQREHGHIPAAAAPAHRGGGARLQAHRHLGEQGGAGRRAGQRRHRERAGRSAEEARHHRQRGADRGQRMGRPPRGHGLRGDGQHPRRAQPLPQGEYLLLFDPLDGSATSTSTSASAPSSRCCARSANHRGVSEEDFLQPGKQQAAAGYCVYGPADHAGADGRRRRGDVHARPRDGLLGADAGQVQIPADTKEFADQHVEHAPLGAAGEALHRRVPGRQGRPARQGLQHALGGLDGGRRAPHPDARRRLHLPLGRASPTSPASCA
jgi:hypothetical protein